MEADPLTQQFFVHGESPPRRVTIDAYNPVIGYTEVRSKSEETKVRNEFRAFYAPSTTELEALWGQGLLVLDTNTLLNLFRYTPATREDFFRVLESFAESLWLPHQVGLEFQQSRLSVIHQTAEAFEKVRGSADSAKKSITGVLNGYKHHPTLNRDGLAKELETLFANFEASLARNQQAHTESVAGSGDPELTFVRITDLFEGRVGKGFTHEQLAEIREEGKTRYEQEVPPGFKDAGKSSGDEFGDLIVWKEILRNAAAEKKPVIFVTDDAKEDWWRREQGRTYGPRTELIDEFWSQVEQRIHFYEPLQFLRYARERNQVPVSEQSLDEVQEVSVEGERIKRVLHHRRTELLRQAEMQKRDLERRRRRAPSEAERRQLLAELSAIDEAQRRVVSDQKASNDELSELIHRATADGGPPQSSDMKLIQQRMVDQEAMEDRTAFLQQRRTEIERQIEATHSSNDRMSATREERHRWVVEELREVELALEDLGE